MVIMGPPLTLISIVKPKRGVGSHVEKGWDPPGPTASHRARFGSHVKKSWDPPTEPDLGPTVEKSSAHRVPPSTYRDTCKAGGFEGAILGPENAHAPILVTRCASRVRVLISASLCGPQNWTNAHSGHSIMKLAWCPESGPANWAENLNKKLLHNCQHWLCPAPPS